MTFRTNSLRAALAGGSVAALLAFAPVSVFAQTAPPAATDQATTPPAATAPSATTPPAPAPSKSAKSKKTKATASAATPATTAPAAAPAAAGAPVFPSAVDAKYASQKAGDQRMHTCLDQYHANKATNGNGGLKWIQKGGGYYSECSKKLKG